MFSADESSTSNSLESNTGTRMGIQWCIPSSGCSFLPINWHFIKPCFLVSSILFWCSTYWNSLSIKLVSHLRAHASPCHLLILFCWPLSAVPFSSVPSWLCSFSRTQLWKGFPEPQPRGGLDHCAPLFFPIIYSVYLLEVYPLVIIALKGGTVSAFSASGMFVHLHIDKQMFE